MATFVSDLVLAMTPVFNHYFLSFISTQIQHVGMGSELKTFNMYYIIAPM